MSRLPKQRLLRRKINVSTYIIGRQAEKQWHHEYAGKNAMLYDADFYAHFERRSKDDLLNQQDRLFQIGTGCSSDATDQTRFSSLALNNRLRANRSGVLSTRAEAGLS
jgi:hypothetical protein